MMKMLRDGLILAPEFHAFLGGELETLKPDGIPTPSFVIILAECVEGNPYALANDLIKRAARSDEVAIAIEIAMAHIVAAKTRDNGGDDVCEWLQIQEELAQDILSHTAAHKQKAGAR